MLVDDRKPESDEKEERVCEEEKGEVSEEMGENEDGLKETGVVVPPSLSAGLATPVHHFSILHMQQMILGGQQAWSERSLNTSLPLV